MSVFVDVSNKPYEVGVSVGTQSINTGEMAIGQGSKVLRADLSGLWLGADKFADAPFRVDMEGNVVATTATLGQYISKTGTSQSFTGSFTVKDSSVFIDGVNGRIVINDGDDDRVVIGNA